MNDVMVEDEDNKQQENLKNIISHINALESNIDDIKYKSFIIRYPIFQDTIYFSFDIVCIIVIYIKICLDIKHNYDLNKTQLNEIIDGLLYFANVIVLMQTYTIKSIFKFFIVYDISSYSIKKQNTGLCKLKNLLADFLKNTLNEIIYFINFKISGENYDTLFNLLHTQIQDLYNISELDHYLETINDSETCKFEDLSVKFLQSAFIILINKFIDYIVSLDEEVNEKVNNIYKNILLLLSYYFDIKNKISNDISFDILYRNYGILINELIFHNFDITSTNLLKMMNNLLELFLVYYKKINEKIKIIDLSLIYTDLTTHAKKILVPYDITLLSLSTDAENILIPSSELYIPPRQRQRHAPSPSPRPPAAAGTPPASPSPRPPPGAASTVLGTAASPAAVPPPPGAAKSGIKSRMTYSPPSPPASPAARPAARPASPAAAARPAAAAALLAVPPGTARPPAPAAPPAASPAPAAPPQPSPVVLAAAASAAGPPLPVVLAAALPRPPAPVVLAAAASAARPASPAAAARPAAAAGAGPASPASAVVLAASPAAAGPPLPVVLAAALPRPPAGLAGPPPPPRRHAPVRRVLQSIMALAPSAAHRMFQSIGAFSPRRQAAASPALARRQAALAPPPPAAAALLAAPPAAALLAVPPGTAPAGTRPPAAAAAAAPPAGALLAPAARPASPAAAAARPAAAAAALLAVPPGTARPPAAASTSAAAAVNNMDKKIKIEEKKQDFTSVFIKKISSIEQVHFNYKELFIKLCDYVIRLSKGEKKYNSRGELEFLGFAKKKFRSSFKTMIVLTIIKINNAYKELYDLIVKFTTKYVEYTSDNDYKLKTIKMPEKSQEIIKERELLAMDILKYDFLFKMLEYYIFYLHTFKLEELFYKHNINKVREYNINNLEKNTIQDINTKAYSSIIDFDTAFNTFKSKGKIKTNIEDKTNKISEYLKNKENTYDNLFKEILKEKIVFNEIQKEKADIAIEAETIAEQKINDATETAARAEKARADAADVAILTRATEAERKAETARAAAAVEGRKAAAAEERAAAAETAIAEARRQAQLDEDRIQAQAQAIATAEARVATETAAAEAARREADASVAAIAKIRGDAEEAARRQAEAEARATALEAARREAEAYVEAARREVATETARADASVAAIAKIRGEAVLQEIIAAKRQAEAERIAAEADEIAAREVANSAMARARATEAERRVEAEAEERAARADAAAERAIAGRAEEVARLRTAALEAEEVARLRVAETRLAVAAREDAEERAATANQQLQQLLQHMQPQPQQLVLQQVPNEDILIFQQFLSDNNKLIINFKEDKKQKFFIYNGYRYDYVRINSRYYTLIANKTTPLQTDIAPVYNYTNGPFLDLPIIRYSGGGPGNFDELPVIFKLYWYKYKIYDTVISKDFSVISGDNVDDSNLILKSKTPLSILNLTKDNGLYLKQKEFNSIVDKLLNNENITRKDMLFFDSIEDIIQNTTTKHTEDKKKLLEYIKETKEKLTKKNIGFKEENIIDTTKTILNFIKVADIFKLILVGLTVICIIIYIMVLLISTYNFIFLLYKIIASIIYLYVNTVLTHNDSLSYTAKNIIRCTKNDYKYDIFNILNEQLTALSVFNTNLYIIYIILGYIILYLLYFIYSSIFSKFYILNGNIRDIDPKFTLITLIVVIFSCSFIHLLIYKFLFKTVCFNSYKTSATDEKTVDDTIINYLSKFRSFNDTVENDKFYSLLTDSTKKDEIDIKFQNMVLELKDDNTINNLGKYLLIYNINTYFQEYLYINDKTKELIKDYFDKVIKGDTPINTFISFLDLNERRLIKASHEELPFYNQIPSDKIEYFKIINGDINDVLTSVNKSIIKYSGTFYPFLFTCIYIFIICIYNIITTYIILRYIVDNRDEQIFPQFIYTMSDKIIDIFNRIYNLVNN